LRACEIKLNVDVTASELRTHRYALQALGERLGDRCRPQLKFRSVKIINIYPFAIPGVSGHDVCDEIRRMGYRDPTGAAPSLNLVGTTPGPARETPWTDLWTWRGVSEDSMSGSVSLPMHSISAQILGDRHPVDIYDVTLRFNTLGNHYVQIEKEFSSPTFTEITQNLRRAFDGIGREKVTYSEGFCKESLVEYASELVKELQNWLSSLDKFKAPISDASKIFSGLPEELTDLNRDHHTLVEIRSATIQLAGKSERDATGDEIRKYGGPLLMQPLPPVAAALHEWMCRETIGSNANFLNYTSFTSDFVTGTGSRTVLCVLSSPDWLSSGYAEVAEFVASLPPLLRSWMLQLDKLAYRADLLLNDNPDDHEVEGSWWKNHETELRSLRFDLYMAVDKIRKDRMHLNPSELVGSSFWESQKILLTRLYDLPTITDLDSDIEARLKRADAVIDRMAARQTRMHDQGIQDDQNRLQLILLFVSLFSFSGVVALFLEARYGADVPGWTSDRAPALVAGVYLLILVLMGVEVVRRTPYVRARLKRLTGTSIFATRGKACGLRAGNSGK
jgi:hypothetical protein